MRESEICSYDWCLAWDRSVLGHDAVVRSRRRLLELILIVVLAAAGVGLVFDTELGLGFALAGIALMIAWWRLKLPPP
jgi:hypothetical protein